MIHFKSISIKNFRAIESAQLTYDSGVWLIKGVNNDAAFESNGSGKSTILMALQQCLYNKTVSPTPIDDASRKSLATSAVVTRISDFACFSN